jgi:hypothetical protein
MQRLPHRCRCCHGWLLGVLTCVRPVPTSIEDMVCTVGTFRIRQYFLRLDPAAAPFFPPTNPKGVKKQIGVVDQPHADATDGGEHGCLHQRQRGGVTVALAVRTLLDASAPWPR